MTFLLVLSLLRGPLAADVPPAGSATADATAAGAQAATPAPAPSMVAEEEEFMDLDRGAGTLSPQAIADTIKKNNWQVADCFSRHGFKGQSGRMTVEFEVDTDGSVRESKKLDSNLGNPMLETCVAGAVKRMKFAKPSGGTVISTWPFLF